MGWLFPHINQQDFIWLYSPDLLENKSWLFTSKEIFPYLYSVPINKNTHEGWIHVNLRTGRISIWESLQRKWHNWPIQSPDDFSENSSGDNYDDLVDDNLESPKLV